MASSSGGQAQKGYVVMDTFRVPVPLGDRLGHDATLGLLELLDYEQVKRSEHVLNVAAERFEKRLTQEVSALRVDLIRELHEGLSGVRQEVATSRVEVLDHCRLYNAIGISSDAVQNTAFGCNLRPRRNLLRLFML